MFIIRNRLKDNHFPRPQINIVHHLFKNALLRRTRLYMYRVFSDAADHII